ncbi:MAG: PEP-CTERM sorting domain-containing protein [Planctomycetota bacterium]|nr:PEP-CTERM sorting domain-containing protein [Planctomycetota bacterium]
MKHRILSTVSLSALLMATVVLTARPLAADEEHEPHLDLSARIVGGAVAVGGWEDGVGDHGLVSPPVFGFDLGSVGTIWLEGDPGMNSPGLQSELIEGTLLPSGVDLRMNLLAFSLPGAVAPSNLYFWDGITMNGSDPAFAAVNPASLIELTLSQDGTSIVANGGPLGDTGFSWGARGGSSLHEHATSILNQNGGAVLPAAGFYLLGTEFAMDSYETSAPTFLIYNAGIDEEQHHVALDFVAENYDSFAIVGENILGDLNSDGFVGQDDLNLILSHWGQTVTAGDPLMGDPSGNGFVGQDDLNQVLGGWGQGAPPTIAPVPEPASILLGGIGLIGVIATIFRRRANRQ